MGYVGFLFLAGSVCLVLIVIFLIFWKFQSDKNRLSRLIEERNRSLEMEIATLTALFDTIPDVIFCKDIQHKHTRVNKQFEKLFDLQRDDILSKTELDFLSVSPEVIEGWHRIDRKVMDEQSMCVSEDIVPRANGESFIYEAVKVPIVIEGKSVGLLGIARDITMRKEMERETQQASNAKSAFIANMSHEIRTPMNSIVGFSELAIEEEMSPKARSYLVKIIESSNWLLQIINDILDVSKIESGKLELEHSPFKLADIFESCKVIIQEKAAEKDIKLHFYAEPSMKNRFLVGDAFRLRQIFINLLTNAVKFTTMGIVRVKSSIVQTTENTQTIHCEVEDTGIGMTADQIKRATEPFMQADVSITRKYGGTGLGLPIVTKLVEMMGGELKIESEIGVGSKFSFTLTFDTQAASEQLSPSGFKDKGKPTFSGEILVCEDNVMNQMVITEHLTRVGIDVTIAENGQIGVEKVRERIENQQKPFDLIFMDIHMPVMDGIDATNKILGLGSETPIVALTANVREKKKKSYLQYGMNDCMGKPFTSQELWKCLTRYIKPISWQKGVISADGINFSNEKEEERELVKKLKEAFVRDNAEKHKEILYNIENGQNATAHRLVHTLKSSAALIEKWELQAISAELESLLRENKTFIPKSKLDTLDNELSGVLKELRPFVARGERRTKIIDDPEKIRELFAELEPLIKNRNPDSLDLLEQLKAIPGAEELASQIESYDFKPALQTLAGLKEVWRID
jgi:PAS domain S-box-containing protein